MPSNRSNKRDLSAMESQDSAHTVDLPAPKVARKDDRLCARLSPDDFLTFDGPTGESINPDSPRGDFFLHLGLHERNYRHRALYRKMKAEAKAGMKRLLESRASLHPELIPDENIVPPFKLTQMTEIAFQREIETIYNTASRSTKGIYDIIDDQHGSWVIRWMLWRVIQARLAEEARALNSGTETDVSIPACSPAVEYALPTPQSVKKSPESRTSFYSPYDYSDSEDWDKPDANVKIKADPDAMPSREIKQAEQRKFWNDVL